MTLIENWKSSWKFYSVWALGIIALLSKNESLVALLPKHLQAHWVTYGAALALIARLVSQAKPDKLASLQETAERVGARLSVPPKEEP